MPILQIPRPETFQVPGLDGRPQSLQDIILQDVVGVEVNEKPCDVCSALPNQGEIDFQCHGDRRTTKHMATKRYSNRGVWELWQPYQLHTIHADVHVEPLLCLQQRELLGADLPVWRHIDFRLHRELNRRQCHLRQFVTQLHCNPQTRSNNLGIW